MALIRLTLIKILLRRLKRIELKEREKNCAKGHSKYSGRRLMGSLWDREKLIPISD
jgi:hypothetical protein